MQGCNHWLRGKKRCSNECFGGWFPGLQENLIDVEYNKEQILIGVTARVVEQKDPVTFMKIAKRIVEQESRAEFIYIGNGEMEQEIKAWIKNEHLEKKIHMLGFRNDASVLVSMFDIYLSSALYEGLPYSVIEAMRARVPIIATDVVGNNELVIDGVNGMLFPVGNVEKGSKSYYGTDKDK